MINEFSQARKVSISQMPGNAFPFLLFMLSSIFAHHFVLWRPDALVAVQWCHTICSVFFSVPCWTVLLLVGCAGHRVTKGAVEPAVNAMGCLSPVFNFVPGMPHTWRRVLWLGETPTSARYSVTFHQHWEQQIAKNCCTKTAERENNGICLSIIALSANLVWSSKMAPEFLPSNFPIINAMQISRKPGRLCMT